MYLEFKWLSIIAFNCSQWRSLPVSEGGWEALLILSDFLAYMMSSMRVIVKARTLHSDTSGACHREQSHTAPTLWQRAGTDSRIPHAGWPKSKFTAWQSRIHLVAAVWSRDPTMKGALWASTDISHPLNSHHQQSSHSEKARRANKQGPLRSSRTAMWLLLLRGLTHHQESGVWGSRQTMAPVLFWSSLASQDTDKLLLSSHIVVTL